MRFIKNNKNKYFPPELLFSVYYPNSPENIMKTRMLNITIVFSIVFIIVIMNLRRKAKKFYTKLTIDLLATIALCVIMWSYASYGLH